ncbi:MAG: hypothetical protein KDA90_09210 [Planctomycetaceae bacterium]|nr:hypothetical protein [Planctomycetaceae bacterium]
MDSTPQRRLLIKTALALQQQYDRLDRRPAPITLPQDQLAYLNRLHRQCQLARQHGYLAAWQRCRRRLSDTLQVLQHPLSTLQSELNQTRSVPTGPSLRLLYEELDSLSVEFADVDISLKSRTLTVTTEPITLEDIDLGPFDICLRWDQLDQDSPYIVRAVEPDSAASNSTVVHPHVQAQRLCEGDGRPAIVRALQDGRIGEFFVLIRQVLQTYNAHSAYVPLESWHGVSCACCADEVAEDDASTCDGCDSTLCSDCTRSCYECDVALCFDCSRDCTACETRYCRRCLPRCSDCHARCCRDCLDEGRCPTCHDAYLDSEHAEPQDPPIDPTPSPPTPSQTTSPTPSADVQPDRVGQAAVPA